MTNKEISGQFTTLAKLLDIHGESSAKVKHCTDAAIAIEQLPYEIEEVGIEAIEGQRGIGKRIVDAILQIMDDGQLAALKNLSEKTPKGILQLMGIRGIGAKKIGQLWRELNIETPEDLLLACNENKLIALKGFAEKTQSTIKEKVEFYFESKGSLLWSQAEQIIEHVQLTIKNLYGSSRAWLIGDYYWQNETVRSFDFIIDIGQAELADALTKDDWQLIESNSNIFVYKYRDQLTFKFIATAASDFKNQLFLHTFSEDMRVQIDVEKLQDYKNEEDAFLKLEMEFMSPFLRNNINAFNKAKSKSLPNIIQLGDIKGVIHNHTNWSDGTHTIEQMANACIERGYEYFVLSDHSKTSFYANGLSKQRIAEQQLEIDAVNEKLKPFRIFKSIECDILGDGNLDYEDDMLATFDVVIASVHQNLTMTEEKAMARLMAAIENPFTSILGHCTGRLLLSRQGYPVNHKKIIDACAANDVVIEINANPRRLDMDWRWIDYCMQKDVLLSINPDAHHINGIDDIRYGVQVAQKGMLPAAMNLSSFSLAEFEEFLHHQHQKRM